MTIIPTLTSARDAGVVAFLLEGKSPETIALKTIGRDYTYGELQESVSRTAEVLSQIGAVKGDRILLAADNSFFWTKSYLGILRAGLVCVPVPTNIKAPELDYILETTNPRLAFTSARFAGMYKSCLENIQFIVDSAAHNHFKELALPGIKSEIKQRHESGPDILADDLAALMFTSGSTGKPRGVMVSHANIIANTESIVQYLGLTAQDRVMTVLPFHYCFGTSLLHTHLRVGASLVIDPRFMYPEKILDRMSETECTGFAGVPSHFQILLRKTSFSKRTFPRLRYVQQAGGHLAPSFVRELRDALPNSRIFVMYGQTEATARLSYVPPEDLDRKLGSIGKAIPGVKLQVLNDEGEEVASGEIGEIAAEGANVSRGYWNEPEESAKCFRNGRLYTGDLGTVDEEGFFYVVDRAKDFIKCGGKRVSCRQLEETLLEFGELLEAAVIGMKDEILGEAVKAIVVPRNSHSEGLEDRVLAFCKEHFAHQLVPKAIVVMMSLPKNSAGKVLKQSLRTADATGVDALSQKEQFLST